MDVLPVKDVRPLVQFVQDEDPDNENEPAGQVPEQEADVRPVVAPNVPAVQLVHEDEPAVEYVPEGHKPEQDEDVKPVVEPEYPAGHERHDSSTCDAES